MWWILHSHSTETVTMGHAVDMCALMQSPLASTGQLDRQSRNAEADMRSLDSAAAFIVIDVQEGFDDPVWGRCRSANGCCHRHDN